MVKGKYTIFYSVAACALVVDQITKIAARNYLADGLPVTVIPSFLKLQLSYNQGAAFGILPDWAPLFVVVAIVIAYALVRLNGMTESRSLSVGLGFLLGGSLGNLVDRLVSEAHAVTDFISLTIAYGGKEYAWPTFNIADIAIVCGAIATVFYIKFLKTKSDCDTVDYTETEE